MKVVAFSDLHGQISRKLTQWFFNNPADLLLFAGDLQLNDLDFGEKEIDWIHHLPYKNKIMTFGNHDGHSIFMMNYVEDKKYTDIKFVVNEAIAIDGINIFGSPYSLVIPAHMWWFSFPDADLARIWEKIPDDTDILITHSPPFGILDKTIDGSNSGSESLFKRVEELKNLKYHIFGHIQESYGMLRRGKKTFINASLLDDKYRLVNNPVKFEYKLEETK